MCDDHLQLLTIKKGLTALLDYCGEHTCFECIFHRTNVCEQVLLSDAAESIINAVEIELEREE